MKWDVETKHHFDQIIEKIPVFLRGIAQGKVSKRAELLAQQAGRGEVSEKDLVDAFFLETPFGFHGPLKMDMESIGIDYTRYGHPK